MTDMEQATPGTAPGGVQVRATRIALSGAPDKLQVLPGTTVPLILQVANRGQIVDQFTLTCQGVDRQWVNVQVGELTLMPESEGIFQLSLRVPDQPPPPAQVYTLSLVVNSRADPADVAVSNVPVEVQSVGRIELEMRPALVRTHGTAKYTANLNNYSNASRDLKLVARDPDEVLEVTIAADQQALDVDGNIAVAVTARPHKRPRIGNPTAYSFRILALPAEEGGELAEPLAGADASLIYEPRLAFLAFLPLWLQRLLLPLLLLLAALALLLWFLFGPGTHTDAPVQPTVVPTAAVANPPVENPQTPEPQAAQKPGTPPDQPQKPPPPVIGQFEIIPPAAPGSGQFQIAWNVTGVDEVKIDGESKPASGSESITDLSDKNYELEATNDGGTVKKSIGILVLRPPTVQSFTADKEQVPPGGSVTLTWETRGGQRAILSGGELDPPRTVDPRSGKLDVQPPSEPTTTYTLTVENGFGRDARPVTVRVAQ